MGQLEITWQQKGLKGWEKHVMPLDFEEDDIIFTIHVPEGAEGVTVRKLLNAFPVKQIRCQDGTLCQTR